MHVNIRTIGDIEHGKMSLVEAINKTLAKESSFGTQSQVLTSCFAETEGIKLRDKDNELPKVKTK